MPAEALHQATRQRVERADEGAVVDRALPAAMEPRLHRETLRNDPDLGEPRQELTELPDAELAKHRGIVVLEADLHQLRQRVEPRDAVVHLKDRLPTGLQHAAAFLHQPFRVARVLNHSVRIHQIERVVRERQRLAVRDAQIGAKPLLLEIGRGQRNRRPREIDARDVGAAPGETGQIHACATADFEHQSAAIPVEVDEPGQMMQLFEVVVIEIVEEPARADRMARDVEIVNVLFPVCPDLVYRGHGGHYTIRARPMTRDIDALSARTFDVLVVGGGIYGLTIACDAAQRGLTVALIERDDFGSGSSFNHLRTIHGGLRYLQHCDLARSRESIRERRTLARIAPHTVRPLLFALPLYRSFMKGRTAMRTGFLLDRLVSFDRNRGVPASHRLARGRVVSKSEAIERFPGLRRRGLTGAATWYDYVTTESDRLTFSWALAAAGHGAVLANHVEALAPMVDGRRVIGVRATDRLAGAAIEISARVTVNATGAVVDELLKPLGLSTRLPLLKSMNLVTNRDAGEEALGGLSASGRSFFLVPWRGRALFGTWESTRPAAPTDTGVKEDEVTHFIDDLNQAFPALELKWADISLVHRGVVPAAPGANGSVTLEGHEQIRDHSTQGPGGPGTIDGLVSVAGTKYTTARAVAERVTNTLAAKLGQNGMASRTADTLLPGGNLGDVTLALAEARRDYDTSLPNDTIPHLIAAYGSRFREVLETADDHAEWRSRLATASPVVGAEIAWAVGREMAMTLADAVIRRTPLGALGYPGEPAAARAAAIMAGLLGWSEARRSRELDTLRAFYKPF